ncbi:MAG: DUF1007 family protein [Fimbriimonadaceae bacterium]|nr:DUF1007 family protein [Alphaproteobacteria bacterium]
MLNKHLHNLFRPGSFLALSSLLLLQPTVVNAHPHVWVEVISEIVFSEQGRITEIRHKWRFDELYSTMAIQGQDANLDGNLTREELASLAELNTTTLSEYEFFTFLDTVQIKAEFKNPENFWLDYEDGKLTLNFTLPLKLPFDPQAEEVGLGVYDETYFVSFSFAGEDAVTLVNAPSACKLKLNKAAEPEPAAEESLSESYFANFGMGASFADSISISCVQD